MGGTIKKVWSIVTGILMAAVVALSVLLVGVRAFGLQIYTVLSGSMEPAYHVGALIYVSEVDTADLSVGDVITFRISEKTTATHRIVEILEEDGALAFRTKGDANEEEDNHLVTEDELVGKVRFTVPYLGFLMAYIQNPPGMYIAIAGAAMFFILRLIPDLWKDDEKKQQEEDAGMSGAQANDDSDNEDDSENNAV